MTEPAPVDSLERFIEMLEGGRSLARSVLRDAGIADEMIARFESVPVTFRPVALFPVPAQQTQECVGALNLIHAIDETLRDIDPGAAVDSYKLVLHGMRISGFRKIMLAAHWDAEHERERQAERGKKGGAPPGIASKFVAELRAREPDRDAALSKLPKRNGESMATALFNIEMSDDEFLITELSSQQKSKPVQIETLARYFRKN